MKKLSVTLLVLLVAFCTMAARQRYNGQYLIGLWAQRHDGRNAIVLRRADGTYLEKAYQRYDFSKPAFYYESAGRWRLRGDQYIITVTHWSAEIFKETLGRTIKRDVLKVDERLFKYISLDGADEEEHKIGEASETDFKQARLQSLPSSGENGPPAAVRKAEPVNATPKR